MKGFTGVCPECGNRRRIRRNHTIGPHTPDKQGPCFGEGLHAIRGTERCEECRKFRADYHVDSTRTAIEPIAHKLDCSQRGMQP